MVAILDAKDYAEWLTRPVRDANNSRSSGTGLWRGSRPRCPGGPRRRSLGGGQG